MGLCREGASSPEEMKKYCFFPASENFINPYQNDPEVIFPNHHLNDPQAIPISSPPSRLHHPDFSDWHQVKTFFQVIFK